MEFKEYKEIKSPIPFAKFYAYKDLRVILGREPYGKKGQIGWHLSISHPRRYPHWDEIKTARYQLMPNNINVAMYLPPTKNYVNVHENCFHLWEVFE